MYDELVKSLRICVTDGDCKECVEYVDGVECSGFFHLAWEAADAIEELSKQLDDMNEANIALYGALPKWIPVTERLPDVHMSVLVMDKAHDMAVGSLEKLWDGEVWVCPFADVEDEQCPITHWMPLPEPPKEV